MIVSGSVKFFNEERGYGFVLPDQPLGDAFFHIASLRKMGIPRVVPGQRAVFEISIAPGRGLRVERFFLIHSGAPEQCALEAELLSSLTQVRSDAALPVTGPSTEPAIVVETKDALCAA
jgi:CspA family cold shock protein